jgi:nicotinamidase-related amidase
VRKRALLLIDFQRDFLRDDGRMPVDVGQRQLVIAAANRAAAAARARGDAVIAIGNEFRRSDWANVFRRFAALAGSEGARWDERVGVDDARYFRKWRASAFCNPDLAVCLRDLGAEDLAIAGLYASACVTATARDALERGFRVTVLSDAVADRSDAARTRALERLKQAGTTLAATESEAPPSP